MTGARCLGCWSRVAFHVATLGPGAVYNESASPVCSARAPAPRLCPGLGVPRGPHTVRPGPSRVGPRPRAPTRTEVVRAAAPRRKTRVLTESSL